MFSLFEGRRGDATHSLIILATFLVLLALASAVVAKDVPGNNGTVKIHGADEAEPVTQNEPQVGCAFHMHFMFGDDTQSGSWEVRSWPPTGDGSFVAASGGYAAVGGEARVDVFPGSVATGHYRLSWDGDQGKNDKHKTFWVTCDGGGGGAPGG